VSFECDVEGEGENLTVPAVVPRFSEKQLKERRPPKFVLLIRRSAAVADERQVARLKHHDNIAPSYCFGSGSRTSTNSSRDHELRSDIKPSNFLPTFAQLYVLS